MCEFVSTDGSLRISGGNVKVAVYTNADDGTRKLAAELAMSSDDFLIWADRVDEIRVEIMRRKMGQNVEKLARVHR